MSSFFLDTYSVARLSIEPHTIKRYNIICYNTNTKQRFTPKYRPRSIKMFWQMLSFQISSYLNSNIQEVLRMLSGGWQEVVSRFSRYSQYFKEVLKKVSGGFMEVVRKLSGGSEEVSRRISFHYISICSQYSK